MKEWLIRKGGYFYRPNRAGYTKSKLEAGRYTEEEARREAEIEPWHMAAVHEKDVKQAQAYDLEAAVERACKAYWPHHWPHQFDPKDRDSIRNHMSAAVVAAIGG